MNILITLPDFIVEQTMLKNTCKVNYVKDNYIRKFHLNGNIFIINKYILTNLRPKNIYGAKTKHKYFFVSKTRFT